MFYGYNNFDMNMSTINMSNGEIAGLTIFSILLYLLQSFALYKYAVAVGQKDKAYKMWIPVAKDHQILTMGKMSPLWLLLIIGAVIPISEVAMICVIPYYVVYQIAIYNMVNRYNGKNFALTAVILSIVTASIGFFIYILLVLIKKENLKGKRGA
jgi:hypothetical protein